MKLSGDSHKKNRPKAAKPPQAQKTHKAAKVRGEKAPRGDKKRIGRRVAVISSLAVAALLVAFVGVGAHATGTESIFPHVFWEGIDLSGLDAAGAADALTEAGVGTDDDETLEVTLPAGVVLSISADDAGFYMSAPDAAAYVYDFCHSGGFLDDTTTYLRALMGKIELKASDVAEPDEEAIREKIADAAHEAQTLLMDTSVDIYDDYMTVVKGATTVLLDEELIFALVMEKLEAGDFSPVTYELADEEVSGMSGIDVQTLYDTVYREPVNAVYEPATQSVTQSVVGRKFDVIAAQAAWDAAEFGDIVRIDFELLQPDVTSESLSSMLFSEILAQKSTSLGGSSYARINNIKLASAAINGLVMNPGDEFSYNGTVGQRTTEKGYMGAGAYNNGEVVTEVGGGICQVSSTLYYCTLISNLKITNRLCHYFGVDYLPAGLDATVSWPSPDFKFVNSSEYPIKIEAYVDSASNTCVVKIHGSNPEGIRVEMETQPLSFADGYGAVSYRVVYDRDGNLISRTEESRSRYYYHTDDEEEEPSESPGESPSQSPSPSPGGSPSPSVPVNPSPSTPVESPPVESPVDPPPIESPPEPPPDPVGPVEQADNR
ncbi:MAG: VanW family protein [Oscillospiraceae bacterium]|jgi:vancomycin resistance protein YoaR|nr:VanW family protein [Oscillospiraceae bacterium]